MRQRLEDEFCRLSARAASFRLSILRVDACEILTPFPYFWYTMTNGQQISHVHIHRGKVLLVTALALLL